MLEDSEFEDLAFENLSLDEWRDLKVLTQVGSPRELKRHLKQQRATALLGYIDMYITRWLHGNNKRIFKEWTSEKSPKEGPNHVEK